MLGETLGRYRIEAELGSGGMGTVYRATGPQGTVAVKVLHEHLLDTGDAVARFRREVEIGATVAHPNVVRTLEGGEADGRHFLVMEYVEGQTLEALGEELERLPEQLCVHVGVAVCKALAAIHAAGVVHRDIKPANVLITPDQVVKVMDLGVARLVDESVKLTQTGMFVGSLHYAAPEQFQVGGPGVDHRADLHALGLLLYEIATGVPAFAAEEVPALIRQVLHEDPRPVGERNPQLSPFFEEIVRRLLAKDREARFGSAEELDAVLSEGDASTWWRERAAALRKATRKPLRRARVKRETAVIGRDAELETLRALFDRACEGDGQFVLVEGDAGIGKTRFVDEFVARLEANGEEANGEGANVLFGFYPPGGGAAGAGALSSAYRDHFGDEGLEDALATVLKPLAPLVPAFAALLRGTAPPDGAAELRRDALPVVFVQTTLALAAERPTILWIDDLHFASDEGRELLAAIAAAAAGHRLLVIGTARPGLSAEWRADADAKEHATLLSLARLGADDVQRVLAQAFGSSARATELGPLIAAKAGGNPFFVFEMLNDLRQAGHLRETSPGHWEVTRRIASIPIPSSVLELVRERLRHLRDEERDLLDLAACRGFVFDPHVVGAAYGMDTIPVLRALAQIEQRTRLVRSVASHYEFDHHQVQETLESDLSELLREAYHAAIADALLEREGGSERDPAELDGAAALQICEHFYAGGRPEQAVRYVDAAIEHLVAASLSESAIALAERALGEGGGVEGGQRIALLLRYADRLGHLGRYAAAQKPLEEAMALADAASDEARAAEARIIRGTHFIYLARLAEAEEVQRDARERAAALGDDALLARACASLGTALFRLGRLDEALECANLAVEHFRAAGSRRAEAQATGNAGSILWRLGRLEEARVRFERHVQLAREVGDRRGEGFATGNLGGICYMEGRFEEARERYARAIEIYREVGYRVGEAYYRGNLGGVLLGMGRYEEGLVHTRAAIRIAREVGQRRSEAVNLINLGNLFGQLGEIEASRDALEAAADLAREVGATNTVAGALCNIGTDVAAHGDPESGRRSLTEALDLARGIQATGTVVECLTALGVVEQQSGDVDAARGHLEEALDISSSAGLTTVEIAARARLGTLPGGDAAPALAALEEHGDGLEPAIAMEIYFLLFRATGDPPQLAHAYENLMFLRDHAPAENRDTMFANVPLHRDIVAAWEAQGSEG